MAGKTSLAGLVRKDLHHAGFADAGFAANVNNSAMARFRYVIEQRVEDLELGTSTDQWHRSAEPLGTLADHPPDTRRHIEPFDRHFSQCLELDQIFDRIPDRIGDQRLSRRSASLQPSRKVDWAADNAIRSFESTSGVARHHGSGGDADVNGQSDADFRTHRAHGAVDFSGSLHSPPGIVAVRDGSAEHAHYVVADMSLYGAAKARDRAVHGLEEPPKNSMGLLRVSPSGQRCVT